MSVYKEQYCIVLCDRLLKHVLSLSKAKVVFVATDQNPMISDIEQHFQDKKVNYRKTSNNNNNNSNNFLIIVLYNNLIISNNDSTSNNFICTLDKKTWRLIETQCL